MKFYKIVPYPVNINPTLNQGFVVQVGCEALAFSTAEALLGFLTEYFRNPQAVVAAYEESTSPSKGRAKLNELLAEEVAFSQAAVAGASYDPA